MRWECADCGATYRVDTGADVRDQECPECGSVLHYDDERDAREERGR